MSRQLPIFRAVLSSNPQLIKSSLRRLFILPNARRNTDSALGRSKAEATERNTGPNQDQLPHVSEEAVSIASTMGEAGPELEQGTPIQEVYLIARCSTYSAHHFI